VRNVESDSEGHSPLRALGVGPTEAPAKKFARGGLRRLTSLIGAARASIELENLHDWHPLNGGR
jgi:hypothetical protein